ncbi:hypothetical protein L21SP5_02161 [Salinivirga cyanobacteriivorans]|uniref:Uncharacterized protein n=1 Tax=Salinivirga cyanobacteriivorans TaxID=1307839 RepID=A0A0S2I0P8_9BACT|nr:hypothetical protein L21SP5_02161 [Salinivirga cyanobacteriivorans]
MKKINQKLYIYFCENLYILNLQFTIKHAKTKNRSQTILSIVPALISLCETIMIKTIIKHTRRNDYFTSCGSIPIGIATGNDH